MPRLTVRDLADLPESDRQEFLESLTEDEREALAWDWKFLARDNQLPPDRLNWYRTERQEYGGWKTKQGDGDWSVWVYLAGRGSGKTRSGAEYIRDGIRQGMTGFMLVAPTAADARDVMVEGESGLMAVCWEHDRTYSGVHIGRPNYEPSKRRLTWENGATATLYSAEEPERLRGPQGSRAWADELAAWKYPRETWDMLNFCVRLGESKIMVTTTPKPIPVLIEILSDPLTAVSTGSTYDNAANLSDKFIHTMEKKYEGTRLGRQELYAEVLEDFEGALWSRSMLNNIDSCPETCRTVIGVDPAISNDEGSNETGIIVASCDKAGRGYVIADLSGRYSPHEWGTAVAQAFHEYQADLVVAEGNQGGELVRHTIQTAHSGVPVKIVHASRGKVARAEPVSALYEQGRVDHVGRFSKLEDQMLTWEANSGLPSPDRIDALVWAFTNLIVMPQKKRVLGVAPEIISH